MMVTFVSQCEKNSLKKTRRVLDAFANRIGDNTWQTLITEDGLQAVKKMLRQTASKNTAVSCHWIRSRSRTQLLWVVGNKKKFNAEGYVPVNRTEKDLLSNDHGDNWKYLPLIKSLSALAALLHDWGKASQLFQDKLHTGKSVTKGDPVRHEWVSCLLFNAYVKSSDDQTVNQTSDQAWLENIVAGRFDETLLTATALAQDAKPLTGLPHAASLLIWLIVSHHRLPLPKEAEDCRVQRGTANADLQVLLQRIGQHWGYENRADEDKYQKYVERCFTFPEGLISSSESWLKQLKFWAAQLQQQLTLLDAAMADGSWRVILHHARLCLMLGDHFYSSQDKDKNWNSSLNLYANTQKDKLNGCTRLKQKLDEHLVSVSDVAVRAARLLPAFETEPLIVTGLDELNPKPDTPDRFKWQDEAVKKIQKWRSENESEHSGFFVVNMASTGCGKTLANAKIMRALSDDGDSLRFILALGLRTLTLQTGDEYRQRVGLDDSQLAVLIGSKAVAELHNETIVDKELKDDSYFEATGSESEDTLLDDQDELSWQGILPEEELTTVLTCEKDRKLLYAPVLACTIDHIMSATETKRGGRYILPCLRLMSSDLVIDEVDDFTEDDLIAIGRLIHLAGMLGRKVMISSATILPDMALGFFDVYQQGWLLFAASRGISNSVGCAWIDENKKAIQVKSISSREQACEIYQKYHSDFIVKRVKELKLAPAKRKANIVACPYDPALGDKQPQYFSHIQQEIIHKHRQHHSMDEKTGVKVSFGVVRVANIQPCVELTQYLLDAHWPESIDVRCMAYHSQQVLLLRHAQEQHLDQVLKRNEKEGEQPLAFSDPVIRNHLDQTTAKHLIFILIATPVEEVGRDHDFDWAVVEPSSYRSIVQLGGRVRRHRLEPVEQANIGLLQYNWKGYEGKAERVFNRPGYETDQETQLAHHDLTQLVDEQQLLKTVDAIPRIQKPESLDPKNSLADLEHFATARTLGSSSLFKSVSTKTAKSRRARRAAATATTGCESLQGYTADYWWLTALPQYFKCFRNSAPTVKLHLLIDEGECAFYQRDDQAGCYQKIESVLGIKHQPLTAVQEEKLWLPRDYSALINARTKEPFNTYQTSLRYGEISFIDQGDLNQYHYNDQLGLVRVKAN